MHGAAKAARNPPGPGLVFKGVRLLHLPIRLIPGRAAAAIHSGDSDRIRSRGARCLADQRHKHRLW
ncbi:hypothetical protein E2C01_101540 [Portunus trituberculatus]|uniref:Uncharacterized protein n=1 Tax=Portunus trituberculatus TaxID=210409 RepID=A0A5B7KM73_PORTR|nr:hypothetical protein [Portunus trituberculatus]